MQKLKIWLLFLILTLGAYGASLKYGFSQDDFFHLIISRATSLPEIFSFFLPASDKWLFFRPVSTQLWYWMFNTIFGWASAPLPMHIAAILLHSFNAYLIYLLTKMIWKLNTLNSLLLSSLYVVSSVHFLSLYYIGATQQLLATFFSLLTIYASLESQYVRAVLYFLLALLSKELSLRLAPLMVIIYLYKGNSLLESLKKSKNIIFVSFCYLLFRYLLGISTAPEYQMDFGVFTTLATLMWYALMTFGFPENILRFGLSGGRVDILSFAGSLSPLSGINSFSATLALALTFIALFLYLKNKTSPKKLFLLFAFWLSGLLPVILLPTHRYAHYLDFSLLALLIFHLHRKTDFLKILALLSLLIAFISGTKIDSLTHWTVARANMASKYTQIIFRSDACSEKTILFTGPPGELLDLSYSLMYENGPRLICNNPSLEVYYTEQVPSDLPTDVSIIVVGE